MREGRRKEGGGKKENTVILAHQGAATVDSGRSPTQLPMCPDERASAQGQGAALQLER